MICFTFWETVKVGLHYTSAVWIVVTKMSQHIPKRTISSHFHRNMSAAMFEIPAVNYEHRWRHPIACRSSDEVTKLQFFVFSGSGKKFPCSLACCVRVSVTRDILSCLLTHLILNVTTTCWVIYSYNIYGLLFMNNNTFHRANQQIYPRCGGQNDRCRPFR